MLEQSAIAPETIRPLRRSEYEQLVTTGSFEGERVELLYGNVVEMSTHGPAHDATIDRLLDQLRDRLTGRARVRVQSAFAASDGSEPQPDLAVVLPRDYDDAHPREAFLLIEVAETSLTKDRKVKAKLYAECGVPEYWVVNLVERRVEVFVEPRGGEYTICRSQLHGTTISLASFPDVVVSVESFLK